MSRALYRLLVWCGRRKAVVSWSLAALAIVTTVGGTVAGATVMASDATIPSLTPASIAGSSGPAAHTRVVTVRGTVLAVRDAWFTLRTERQRVIVVRTDSATRYRHQGAASERSELRQGQRVTILGRIQPNGRLRARAVAVRGEASVQDAGAARPRVYPRQ